MKKSKSKEELATKPAKSPKVPKSKKMSLETAQSMPNVDSAPVVQQQQPQQQSQFQPAMNAYVNTMTSPFNGATAFNNPSFQQVTNVIVPQQFQTLPVSSFLNSPSAITIAAPTQQQQQQLPQQAAFIAYPNQAVQFQPQTQHYGQILPQQPNQFTQFFSPQTQLAHLQTKPLEYTNLSNGSAFPQNMNGSQMYMNPQQMYYYYYQQQQQHQIQQQVPVQSIIIQQTPLNNQKFTLPPGNT